MAHHDLVVPRFALSTLGENSGALRQALERHSFLVLEGLSEAQRASLGAMQDALEVFGAAVARGSLCAAG